MRGDLNIEQLLGTATRALPLMTPERRAEAEGIIAALRTVNGDVPGHPFRGNQYTEDQYPAAPDRITPAEADAQLSRGFSEQDTAGRTIRFGHELKKKLDGYGKEGAARKRLLEWAKDTVKTGVHAVRVEKDEQRTHYGKLYQDGPKRRGFMVIVDTQDGYAFNIHLAKPKQLARRTGNEGAITGEQPPAGILKALAAAGGSQDHFEITPAHGEKQLEIAEDAFARDMQPVCKAIVSALHAGDMQALVGLRAMLPTLLGEVTRTPELADVFTRALGRALVAGADASEEEVE